MQIRSAPTEHMIDMRVNPAAPTGSRVRNMLQHDVRWLREVGMGPEVDWLMNQWNGISGAIPPIPAQRRYSQMTPEITRAALDLLNSMHPEGAPPPLPRPRPQRRYEDGK